LFNFKLTCYNYLDGSNAFVQGFIKGKTAEFSTMEAMPGYAERLEMRDLPSSTVKEWTPKGTLLAHLQDHMGPIHALSISKDGSMLVSASEDGTLKAWEVARVHKNLAVKPRVTHHAGGSVRCAMFLGNSHVVACGTETGNVQLVKFHMRSRSCEVVRDIKVPGEVCVALSHYQTDIENILLVITSSCRIYGFNPTTVAFELKTPLSYGT
jgi:phosphoinositide-3-kinase regulatory subunit 4